MALDPRTNAVRPDLADVRLAGKVFAPHFAAPLLCRTVHVVALWATREGGVTLSTLNPDELFEVLELSGECAWGRAPHRALVGYVSRHALERA